MHISHLCTLGVSKVGFGCFREMQTGNSSLSSCLSLGGGNVVKLKCSLICFLHISKKHIRNYLMHNYLLRVVSISLELQPLSYLDFSTRHRPTALAEAASGSPSSQIKTNSSRKDSLGERQVIDNPSSRGTSSTPVTWTFFLLWRRAGDCITLVEFLPLTTSILTPHGYQKNGTVFKIKM